MATVVGCGLHRWLHRRAVRSRIHSKWFALALGGTLLTSSILSAAQVTPAREVKKDQASATKPAAPDAVNTTPPPAIIQLPPMTPVCAPMISWDGRFLTIDAENSTLSDILLGIRARTGASIEMPGSTSAERVSLHVGPAPIREVLSSLLYGTNFNYVIQASEDDESGLGKVILISRDGGDAGDDSTAGEVRADRSVRLMPGYGAPGKRDFEVAHTRAMQAAAAAADNTVDSGQDAQSPAADNDAGSNQASAADSQPVASNSESTDSSTSQPDTMLTAAGQPISAAAAGITPGNTASTSGDTSTISGMEQTLQKLYQQRQQIQAQQNKPQPPAQTPAP